MSITIRSKLVFVVEGKDEERFFSSLLNHMGITDFQVLGVGGKTRFTANLKAMVLTPTFAGVARLAVFRDADEDPAAAFESVCYSFEFGWASSSDDSWGVGRRDSWCWGFHRSS